MIYTMKFPIETEDKMKITKDILEDCAKVFEESLKFAFEETLKGMGIHPSAIEKHINQNGVTTVLYNGEPIIQYYGPRVVHDMDWGGIKFEWNIKKADPRSSEFIQPNKEA